jgi:hypothetical protein
MNGTLVDFRARAIGSGAPSSAFPSFNVRWFERG